MKTYPDLSVLDRLHWIELVFTLQNTSPKRSQAHYLTVVDAIVREPNKQLGVDGVFQVRNRTLSDRQIQAGDRLDVTVILPATSPESAMNWIDILTQFVNRAGSNHAVVENSVQLYQRSFADFQDNSSTVDEIMLDFHTPFAFTPFMGLHKEKKREQWRIDAHELLKRMAVRIKKLFAVVVDLSAYADEIRVYPEWWRYERIIHRSRSNPTTRKWLKGCVGPLPVGGNVDPLVPLFRLCSAVNGGSEINFGQGAFTLHEKPESIFCRFDNAKSKLSTRLQFRIESDHAARIALAAEFGQPVNVNEIAGDLAKSLRDDTYVPQPTRAFTVAKKNGTDRIVETLSPLDDSIHHYLSSTAYPIIDKLLEPQAFAYRKTKSRQEVKKLIEESINDGYTHVMITDINSLFPSVKHRLLVNILREHLPSSERKFIDLISRCIKIPIGFGAVEKQRDDGLCQGSPLSPMLANLYLDSLDEGLQQHDLRFVRYADDFAIFAQHDSVIEDAVLELQKRLELLELQLHSEKSWQGLASDGFEYLGFQFGGRNNPQQTPVFLHRRPVYITENYCFLGNKGDALYVTHKENPSQLIPFRRISSIHVLSRATFSSSMLSKCKKLGIAVTIVDGKRTDVVSWVPERPSFYEVAYLQRMDYERQTNTARLEVAKEIVTAKVFNGITLLSQRKSKGFAEWEKYMNNLIEQINDVVTHSALLGIEGVLAKKYFEQWSVEWDGTFFEFSTRMRSKTDPINSMLNFGYSLLFARINTTVRGLGLNPYLGWLHGNEQRFETLVVDMQEPFRAHVDRMIARTIGLKVIRSEHFHPTKYGQRFTPDGMRLFIEHFELMMNTAPKSGGLSLAESIQAQSIAVRNYFLKGDELRWFRVSS